MRKHQLSFCPRSGAAGPDWITLTCYGNADRSRLASLGQDLSGTAHDLSLSFTYNPAGQIASAVRSNDAYAWGGHFNRDRGEAVNGLNQLTAQGVTGLGYDGRGNVTSIGGAGYGYTSENRLASAPGGYVMTHDPLGRYHWISSGGPHSWMQYDGANIIEERDGSGVARRYGHGPGTDEPLVWYEGSGTGDRRWLHADERGSIVAVTNSAGAAISINSYDEYGVPAAGNTGRFQYTGQAWLPELQMYHYKARTYAPKLGRFLQADPLDYADGMSMYGYVGGDPVNGTDPSGLTKVTCTGSIIARNSLEECGSAGFLSMNGVDTQAAAMAREIALASAVPGISTVGINQIAACMINQTAACMSAAIMGLPTNSLTSGQDFSLLVDRVSGAAPWDPKGESGYYVINPVEEAAIMETHGQMTAQLSARPGPNRKIGMHRYHNNSHPRLPDIFGGQWYSANIGYRNGDNRLLINTSSSRYYFYTRTIG